MKVTRIIRSRCLRANIDADSLFRKYGKEIVKEVRESLRENILDRYDNEEYWDYDVLEEGETSNKHDILREDILDRYDNEEYWDYELMEGIVQDYLADKGLPVENLIKDGTFENLLSKVAKEL
ncbi:MAG TPA: hypothetical protein P5513_06055 [Candidatus Diapherotrites archaeon]|nr:hypothetical protein [Candidatus Diapherotrites archaeon]